jgi:hypothetical protein
MTEKSELLTATDETIDDAVKLPIPWCFVVSCIS